MTKLFTLLSYHKHRIQSIVFHVVLLVSIVILGWLGNRYQLFFDWTDNNRNSLSLSSQMLLTGLPDPIDITAYASKSKLLRQSLKELIARFQRIKPDIQLRFVDPEQHPDVVRSLGISTDGTMILRYKGKYKRVVQFNEQAVSNAILQVSQTDQMWVVFLSGHEERDPTIDGNHHYGEFGKNLAKIGFKTITLNLAQSHGIPANAAFVVIAGPLFRLLPREVLLLENYVDAGGNLLWLMEPGDMQGLDSLAAKLQIEVLPGTVVDATSQQVGINDPSFAVLTSYPQHAITKLFKTITVFPKAAALIAKTANDWQVEPFLQTQKRSWTETSPVSGNISYDKDKNETRGPLTIGLSLLRQLQTATVAKEQRIVILGDSDFLNNAYIGNGGNLNLGLNIFNWLSDNAAKLTIPARSAPDQQLILSNTEIFVVGFAFLLVIPIGLVIIGGWIWQIRRKR